MRQSHLVEITPEMAQDILSGNIGNRPLDLDRVNKFRDIILSGQWNPKKGHIDISKDGRLLNGQHRLMAIKQSGMGVKVHVVKTGEKND